jgi:hypothetical protein
MTFINEVVSDEDIDRYGLPFKKGSGRYWTRDAERDYYLWGGLSGNPAYGDETQGRFHFYIDKRLYRIVISPGEGSLSYSESPFRVGWKSLLSVEPSDLRTLGKHNFLSALREALLAYGDDGEGSRHARNLIVSIGF